MDAMTLGQWLDTWMELYVEPTRLAKSTKAMYNRAVRAVPERLRSMELMQVSDLHLRPWLLEVARVFPRAAQLDRQMLHRSLKIAGKLGLCRPGLVDEDTNPRIDHEPAETAVLDTEQLRRYFAAAVSRREFALAFCACGLRRGEARGITWADVDLESGLMTINGQRQGCGTKQPCKSRASVRMILLPRDLVAALRPCRRWGGEFIDPRCEQSLYQAHRALLAAVGLPCVTLHGLRHSIATACVAQGDAMAAVQGLLGHSHYALTADVYANHLHSPAIICERLFA